MGALSDISTLLKRDDDKVEIKNLNARIALLWEWIRNLEAEIERLHYDQKTGALRGDFYLTELEKLFTFAKKINSPLVIFLVDLDDFKVAQDSRSHAWGDVVLRETVQVIRKCLRSSDLVFRYGAGDEFLVAALCKSEDVAVKIRDRLEKSMAEKVIFDGEFSGSVGLTSGMAFSIGEFTTKLIDQADEDLRLRKQQKKVGR